MIYVFVKKGKRARERYFLGKDFFYGRTFTILTSIIIIPTPTQKS